jgi:hypothetical protein
VRSNVLAFVSINSDFGSSQWHTVANLLRKFPSGGQVLGQVQTGLSSQGVNYKRDIAPALGPEVDLVVTGISTTGASVSNTSFAVMTKPKDEGKLKKLLNKAGQSGSKPVYEKVNGWYVFSTTKDNIHAAMKKGGKSLGDEGSFKRAMDALPKGALVKSYVSGKGLANIVRSLPSAQAGTSSAALGNLDFLGLALSAENDGFRLVGAAKGGTASKVSSGSTYSPKLVSEIPSGALAVVSARGGKNITSQLQKALQNPSIGPQIQQFQTALGVTPQQLFGLLEHELAFYVRPGALATTSVPELTLLLETPDQAKSLSTVNTLMTRLARLAGTTPTVGAGGAKTVKVKKIAVSYAGFNNRVIVTTGPNGVADAKLGGQKLSDDPVYKDAKSAAGVPDKTGGFVYVNLQDSIPLIEAYEQRQGSTISPTTRDNLAPLKSLFAFASSSGGVGKFTFFVEIK